MALRSVCGGVGSTLKKFTNPNIRSFHTNMVPGTTRDLEWFTEGFSAQPDNINAVMSSIYTGARQSTVTPFSLQCRSLMDRWAIKGLRIEAIQKQKTPSRLVVIVSGMHASEPIPIGVSLYVASALSKNPITGVEVTVFPVLKPRDLELQCRNEQIIQAMTLGGITPLSASQNQTRINEHERVEGPLRSYVMKRSTNFVDVVVDLNALCSTMSLKHNSLARSLRNADMLLGGLPQSSCASLATEGEPTLLDKFMGPPAIIVELRDRNKKLGEDQIIPCGEHVLSAIYKVLADTNGHIAR